MNTLKQHITALNEVLAGKEYDGYFLTNSDYPGKLKDSLLEFFAQQKIDEDASTSLTLATYSDWKDDKSDYTLCYFKAHYKPETGFQINELEIERTKIYARTADRKFIAVKDHYKDIPEKKKANELVNPGLRSTLKSDRKRIKR